MNRLITLLLVIAGMTYVVEGLAITFHILDPMSTRAFQGALLVAAGAIFTFTARPGRG